MDLGEVSPSFLKKFKEFASNDCVKKAAIVFAVWLVSIILLDFSLSTVIICVVLIGIYCKDAKKRDEYVKGLLNAINSGKRPDNVSGPLNGVFLAHRNILRQIERERDFYKERYENFVSLVNSFELPIVLIDSTGEIRFYNKAFKNCFNGGKEIGNERIFSLLRRNGLKVPIKRGNFQVFSRRQNKRYMVVVEGGEKGEFSMIFTDITARWKTEKLLEKTMRYAVSAETVADLAHGLKQPLANLQLAFDLYRRTGKDQNLQRLEKELRSLKEKIYGVLQIYHYGEEPQDVDLLRVLDRVVKYLKPIADAKGVELQLIAACQHTVVKVQERRLENVIKNIVVNAIEAIVKDKGKVVLKLRNEKEGIILLIGDNGMGMSKTVFEKAFKAFFTTKENGTGLGLTLTKSFCEDNDVSFRMWSKEGKGTVIRLMFKR
ncbi:sensor histidine kinase [Kosmotoga pacifica]|uniref:sensor histidine kinase n=1 Tax=Kosmotoga pacifica TaxID=1330330 RepID=UPI00146FE256|nr:sensor histidine kinase [Kosmotoga pacifica]